MKLKIKNLKTNFLYIILPIGLILILVIVLYQSNQRVKVLKSGIDLKPRPFSELLASDFTKVEDEVVDLSKCRSLRIVKSWEEEKKKWNNSKNTSLFLKDNCWIEYENKYFKFQFRDINDSAVISPQSGTDMDHGVNIAIDTTSGKKVFSIAVSGMGEKKDQYFPIKLKSDLYKVTSATKFLIKKNIFIYRVNYEIKSALGIEEKKYYIISFDDKKFLSIYSESRRFMEEVLPTLEFK